MTAMVQVNAPSQAAPSASFLPSPNGLSNEQRKFSPIKELSNKQPSLSTTPLLIQPKLAIGEPDDKYEREADRVAETVMRMTEPKIQRT
jgi:hypothetical protein